MPMTASGPARRLAKKTLSPAPNLRGAAVQALRLTARSARPDLGARRIWAPRAFSYAGRRGFLNQGNRNGRDRHYRGSAGWQRCTPGQLAQQGRSLSRCSTSSRLWPHGRSCAESRMLMASITIDGCCQSCARARRTIDFTRSIELQSAWEIIRDPLLSSAHGRKSWKKTSAFTSSRQDAKPDALFWKTLSNGSRKGRLCGPQQPL
jgi:hypothetical protein